MSDPGWTLDDLAGELMVRGIDLNDVSDSELRSVINRRTPERAADDIYYGGDQDPDGW